MRVGFIGLGSQGGPMARRIVEGGYELTLWARRPATLEPYADTAAKAARSPAELAAASDLVCLCVVGDDDVSKCSTATPGCWPGLAPGGIIAIHSTVHPDTCREIAKNGCRARCFGDRRTGERRRACRRGGHAAGHGRRRRRGDVERCRPVFATYADPIVHLGPLGTGQVTKILNNLLFTANLGSAISTLELGESLGIDRNRLCEVLNGGSATSKALGSIAVFGGTLDGLAPIAGALLQKDVRHAASLADSRVGSRGRGVHRGGHRVGVDGLPAMTTGRLRRRRGASVRRWCAGSSMRVTTSVPSAVRREVRRRSRIRCHRR